MATGQLRAQEHDGGDDLWLPAAPRRRAGPRSPAVGERRAPLSRRQIVEAAIAIADAEGAEALGMRRVARELGVGNMSVYWHVASKEDLLALMIDTVEGEFEVPEPSGDWRSDLSRTAHNIRAVLLRHGWMVNFVGFRRSLGPSELNHIENSLAALCGHDLGLDISDAFKVLMALETYVLGFALRDQQELFMERSQPRPRRRGAGPDAMHPQLREHGERLRTQGRYPLLTKLLTGGAPLSRDSRFEYGLACLLDGIEMDLRSRSSAKKRSTPRG